MPAIQLSATPKGNGYQATVTFPDGVSISSAETYPTIAEAMTAAAIKLLDMPQRLEALDRPEASATATAKRKPFRFKPETPPAYGPYQTRSLFDCKLYFRRRN